MNVARNSITRTRPGGRRAILSILSLGALIALTIAPAANATHDRPAGASPLRVPLVPAQTGCGAPNTTHGPPLALPSCTPPSQTSNYLWLGTADVNGAPAQGAGFYRVIATGTDASVQVQQTDVRCQPPTAAAVCTPANTNGPPDYVGQVEAVFTTVITDHQNPPTPPPSGTAGTTVPTTFPITVPCSLTGSTTIGGTCSISTTYNTIIPGVIKASAPNHRAIWEYSQIQVNDGGADGDVSTAPNTLFLVQGMFFP